VAEAGVGNVNLAWTGLFTRLNAANEAYAQYGNGNVAAIWGNGNTARAGGDIASPTGNDRNLAIVAGQVSTANAGPGSNNRVVVLGSNTSQSKPAAGVSARATRQR
jgi:hypothetical protein